MLLDCTLRRPQNYLVPCLHFFAVLSCSGQTYVNNATSASWHDPSPHSVQMIAVDKGVQLEVLDWGGTGRPVVLLSGLGDTAHISDDFAQKLRPLPYQNADRLVAMEEVVAEVRGHLSHDADECQQLRDVAKEQPQLRGDGGAGRQEMKTPLLSWKSARDISIRVVTNIESWETFDLKNQCRTSAIRPQPLRGFQMINGNQFKAVSFGSWPT